MTHFIIDQLVYDAGRFLFSEGKQNYTLYIKAKYAEGIFMSIRGKRKKVKERTIDVNIVLDVKEEHFYLYTFNYR